MLKKLSLLILFLITLASPAYARSFSIEEVKVRAWIQPDGDLLVNEIFTYDFDGDYKRVIRSVHKANHQGVSSFEAYELGNPKADLGFVDTKDLRRLKVTRQDNSYFASLPSHDEKKYVFFTYELKNAVKTYETYSDLTVPFFGEGSNHDVDLQDLTIDFVFPEEIKPSNYHAFFHGINGKVKEKGESVVRFTAPVSSEYSLTETRLLFPSTVMKNDKKQNAPMSFEKAVAEEKKRAAVASSKTEKLDFYQNVLLAAVFMLGLGILFLLAVLLLNRARGNQQQADLMKIDPLTLYLVHRRGKQDHYAFLAGLFALVEKGAATVKTQKTSNRFLKDAASPDQTLFFHLLVPFTKLTSKTEQKLAAWLFKKKPTLSLNDLAGASKQEKGYGRQLHKYRTKYENFRKQEKVWFLQVIQEAKSEGLLKDTWFKLLSKGLSFLIFVSVLMAYYADSKSTSNSLIYAGIAGVFLIWTWIKPMQIGPWLLLFGVSLISSLLVTDEQLLTALVSAVLLAGILYLIIPRMTLSKEGLSMKAAIRDFKKKPTTFCAEPDKIMIRSLLLQNKRQRKKLAEIHLSEEVTTSAPLLYLIASDQEPVQFLNNSWKWSVHKDTSSSTSYSDSGSSSDSGGGDGGGGASAD